MTPEQYTIRVAASQHGLISRQQALELGLSEKQLQTLLERGRWRSVRPGAYAVGGAPETNHMQLLAACMAAGNGAVGSHRASVWTWGLDGSIGRPLEITVEASRGPVLPGVIVHITK